MAYEMRISDWSSDVVSADLRPCFQPRDRPGCLIDVRCEPVMRATRVLRGSMTVSCWSWFSFTGADPVAVSLEDLSSLWLDRTLSALHQSVAAKHRRT